MDGIAPLVRAQRKAVVALQPPQNLRDHARVHAQREVAVDSVVLEAVRLDRERDHGHMGRVHGLQVDAALVYVHLQFIIKSLMESMSFRKL